MTAKKAEETPQAPTLRDFTQEIGELIKTPADALELLALARSLAAAQGLNGTDDGATAMAERAPDIDFVVPFLYVPRPEDEGKTHGICVPAPNPELLGMYLSHVRSLIDIETVKAVQSGECVVGMRVSVTIDAE